MTRTITALTIALLISAGTEAEAQTGEWKIGDLLGKGDVSPYQTQIVRASLSMDGEFETVGATLMLSCELGEAIIIFWPDTRHPNFEEDRIDDQYLRLPAKIDGVEERVVGMGVNYNGHLILALKSTGSWMGEESLEILFAWGRDGQRQSLAWSMDGMRETFSDVCGREQDAEETGTEAEAQTGEWEIFYEKDEWGDPNGDKIADQTAIATLAINGENEVVMATLFVRCLQSESLDAAINPHQSSRHPNLEKDESGQERGKTSYSVPAKIDGNKTELAFRYVGDIPDREIRFQNPERLIKAKESLEILFAWGRDGQRQSLTWSMDGLREVFPEACGEELEAEGEAVIVRLHLCESFSSDPDTWTCLKNGNPSPETRGWLRWKLWPSRPEHGNWSFPMELTCPAGDFAYDVPRPCRAKGRTYWVSAFIRS